MGYGTNRAIMESQLANAHKALFRAAEAADRDGDFGAVEDLEQLLREVTRIAEGSLKNTRRPRPLKGQLVIES